MDNQMILRHERFKMGLANVINQSGLPAFVVEYVLRDYIEETHRAAGMQYYDLIQNEKQETGQLMTQSGSDEGDNNVVSD